MQRGSDPGVESAANAFVEKWSRVELTERALTARPKEVLGAVRWLRRRGCRIRAPGTRHHRHCNDARPVRRGDRRLR